MAVTREDRLIEAAADETGFTFEQSLGELGLKVVNGVVTVDWQAGWDNPTTKIEVTIAPVH